MLTSGQKFESSKLSLEHNYHNYVLKLQAPGINIVRRCRSKKGAGNDKSYLTKCRASFLVVWYSDTSILLQSPVYIWTKAIIGSNNIHVNFKIIKCLECLKPSSKATFSFLNWRLDEVVNWIEYSNSDQNAATFHMIDIL